MISVIYKFLNMQNATVILAVFGALLGTINTIWNITNAIRLRRRLVKVTAQINTRIPVRGSEIFDAFVCIDIDIVNSSEKVIYIQAPKFEFNQKDDSRIMTLYNFNEPHDYPLSLSPGQKHSVSFHHNEIVKSTAGRIKAKKFRIIVKDTLGKYHNSKWYKTKSFELVQ